MKSILKRMSCLAWGIIFLFTTLMFGCDNKRKNVIEKNTYEEVCAYLADNELEMLYPDFQFTIENTDDEDNYYIFAVSWDYDLDKAEELVDNAKEDGVSLLVFMGSELTCLVSYNYDNNNKPCWYVVGNSLVQNAFSTSQDINKQEIQTFLNEKKGNLADEATIKHLLVSSYRYVTDSCNEGAAEFENLKLFVEYSDAIMQMRSYEVEKKENNQDVVVYYFAPMECIKDEHTITFLYEEGYEWNVDTSTWTSTVKMNEITTENNSTDDSDLQQALFDSINYSLSIGMTSNCDMSQETLKAIYEKIADRSFFEESMFSYITEYGKDRYNYEIGYDALTVAIYYDCSNELYGFDILEY